MKLAIWLGLFGALLGPIAAPCSSGKLERCSISGAEYIRLEDWGRANGFSTKWTVPRQELKLTSAAFSLSFTVDSARMSMNGIHVWLSAPVALRNGSVWIASMDTATAIQPLLFPMRTAARKPIKTIVLDPGHGGKDPGNFEGRQQEKKYTLLLANEVGELLKKAGFKVSLTRSSDMFLDLPARPDLARRRGADLFVSLHFNSFEGAGGPSVRGVEVYCMTPVGASSTNARGEGAGAGAYPGNRFDAKSLLLGYQIQKSLVKNLAVEDRGLRRARWAVLRSAEMPAVLIEGGFMTNPSEAKRIYDSTSRRQMAQAIVEGVKAYRNLTERPGTTGDLAEAAR